MCTELVADALKNAAAATLVTPGAIGHSDRGSVHALIDIGAMVAGLDPRDAIICGTHRPVRGQQRAEIVLRDAQQRASQPNPRRG